MGMLWLRRGPFSVWGSRQEGLMKEVRPELSESIAFEDSYVQEGKAIYSCDEYGVFWSQISYL